MQEKETNLLKKKKQASEAYKKLKTYEKEHSIKETKNTKFISCPKCESKLRLMFLKDNYCPLCSSDLRPLSVQNKIAEYKKEANALYAEIMKEEKQQN